MGKLQKPDTVLTASSYYSSKAPISPSSSLSITRSSSSDSITTSDNDQTNLIRNSNNLNNLPKTPTIKFNNISSNNSKESKQQKHQSQFKIHRYTIYDDEKEEFIEIIEEEWDGEGDPPNREQKRNTVIIMDKDLPKLPIEPSSLDKNSLDDNNNSLRKFIKWLETNHPSIFEFINKYQKILVISFVSFLILLFLIIILACAL
ncbi:9772_t:CDS:2 [Diversispora eburnea]|uniref:9772_t:CDS:1 n=1 Tax=Diversispora eburnea TaxID=1213867 RepID=A0A9N9BQP2_9GLOM|nr:9772_t:CDS:2 [Diversispora eburnea]